MKRQTFLDREIELFNHEIFVDTGCRRARKFPSRRQNEKRRPRGRGGRGGGLTRDCRGKFLDEIAGSPFRCNETAFHSTGKNIATPRCRDN